MIACSVQLRSDENAFAGVAMLVVIFILLQDVTNLMYNPCCITKEEYFDPGVSLKDRDIGRPIEQTTKIQKFKAQLWLCEQYPLSLPEQVSSQSCVKIIIPT